MESKEAQASGFDVDSVRNGLENLRFELAKFNLSHQGVNLGLNAQQSGIKHMHDNMMSLAKHYTTLMSTLSRVQDKIDNKRKEIQDIDNQYEVLSKEREQLQREQKELFTEEKFQQINEKLSEGNASMAKDDLEIEQRLRDFTREDLFQRMDAFNNVKERLTNTNVEFRTEWESYKTETREFRQELKPYRDDIDNLNNLIVSRLRGLGMHNQNLTAADREAIDRTVKYYQLEKEFKERQEKFVDSQIILRDLQDEMSGLMTERQALWKQNENLELQIDQLQPEGQKTGFLLHHADRHTDLPHTDHEFQEDYFGTDNEDFSDVEVSLGGEENHCGGLMLHRCMKMTNIPLVMNSTQDVDAEAVTTDLFEDEDKDIEQEQEDEERETMSGKTYHDQVADLGPPGDDRDPDDEEDEDEEEGEGEENFTILDSSMQSMLPSGPSGSLGFGPQPGDSEDDDEEGENDGEDGPNDGSGGTNEQQQQQSKAQRYHAMADAPDTPASLISKVRGRLGAPSTSSKNLLESRGIAAGSNPLTKQSSAKFGESTFSVTRRGRRK